MSASSSALPSAPFAEVSARPAPVVGPSARFDRVASDEQIERAADALRAPGFEVRVVPDAPAARAAVRALVPPGAEVLNVTSQTLTAVGVAADLEDPAQYDSVRPKLVASMAAGRPDDARRAGASPAYVVGSVHAVTEDGQVLVASGSGSQLAPYVYGAGHVVWVVGAQKIVPDLATAIRRLNEYTFPLEDARAQAAYGRGSAIAKLLVVGLERPGRTTVVLVKENLGF